MGGDDKSKSLLHPHAERSISHSGGAGGGVCHPGCQCAEMKMDDPHVKLWREDIWSEPPRDPFWCMLREEAPGVAVSGDRNVWMSGAALRVSHVVRPPVL